MPAYMGSFAQGFIEAYLKAKQLKMYQDYFRFRMIQAGYNPDTGEYHPVQSVQDQLLANLIKERMGMKPGALTTEGGGGGYGAPDTGTVTKGGFNMDRANALVGDLTNRGVSPEVAKGFVAGMMGESGRSLDPTSMNTKEYSGGFGQWHLDRLQNLFKFAGTNDIHNISFDTQRKFWNNELDGPYANVVNKLKNASTWQDGVNINVDNYEKPQDRAAAKAQRYGVAKALMQEPGPAATPAVTEKPAEKPAPTPAAAPVKTDVPDKAAEKPAWYTHTADEGTPYQVAGPWEPPPGYTSAIAAHPEWPGPLHAGGTATGPIISDTAMPWRGPVADTSVTQADPYGKATYAPAIPPPDPRTPAEKAAGAPIPGTTGVTTSAPTPTQQAIPSRTTAYAPGQAPGTFQYDVDQRNAPIYTAGNIGALFHAPPNWTEHNPPPNPQPAPNLTVNIPHPSEAAQPAQPAQPQPAAAQPTQSTYTRPPWYTNLPIIHEGYQLYRDANRPPPQAQPAAYTVGPGSTSVSPGASSQDDWMMMNMMRQSDASDSMPYMPMMYSQTGGPVTKAGPTAGIQQLTGSLMGTAGQQQQGQSNASVLGTALSGGGGSSGVVNYSATQGNPAQQNAQGLMALNSMIPTGGGQYTAGPGTPQGFWQQKAPTQGQPTQGQPSQQQQASTLPGYQYGGAIPSSPRSRSKSIPRRPHLDLTRQGGVRNKVGGPTPGVSMQGGGPLTPVRPEDAQIGRSASTTYGATTTPGISFQEGGDVVPPEDPSFQPSVSSAGSVAALQGQVQQGASMMGSAAAREGDMATDVRKDQMRHKLGQVAQAPGQSQPQTPSPIGQFMNQIPFVQQMEQWKTQMASWPSIFNPQSQPQSPSPMFRRGGIVTRFQAGGDVEDEQPQPQPQPAVDPDSVQAIPPEGVQVASTTGGVHIPHMMSMPGGGFGRGLSMGTMRPRIGMGGAGVPREPSAGKYGTPSGGAAIMPEWYEADDQSDANRQVATGTPQIADSQGNPSRGFTNAVLGGMGWVASKLTGQAIPQQGRQPDDLAASHSDMNKVYKAVDPENRLTMGMKNIAAMEAVSEFYMLNGRPDLAKQYVGGMLMYSRVLAAKYGDTALKELHQNNYDEAVQAEIDAGNMIPDGTQYTAYKTGDKSYVLQNRDLNSKVLWEQQIGPREIMAAAVGAQSGMAYWSMMQRFGAQYDPDSSHLLAAKDEADKESRAAEAEAEAGASMGPELTPYTAPSGGGGPQLTPAAAEGDQQPPLISPTFPSGATDTGAYAPSNLPGSPTAITPSPSQPSAAPPQPGPPAAQPDQGQETAIPQPWQPYRVAGEMQPPPTMAPTITPRVTQPSPTPAAFGAPTGYENTEHVLRMQNAIQAKYFDPTTNDPLIGNQVFRKPNEPRPTGNPQVDRWANQIYREREQAYIQQVNQNKYNMGKEISDSLAGYRMDLGEQNRRAAADIQAQRDTARMREQEYLKQQGQAAQSQRDLALEQEKNRLQIQKERSTYERPLDENYTLDNEDGTKTSGIKIAKDQALNALLPPGTPIDPAVTSDHDKQKILDSLIPSREGQGYLVGAVHDILRWNHTENAVPPDQAGAFVRQMIGDPTFDNKDPSIGATVVRNKTSEGDKYVDVDMYMRHDRNGKGLNPVTFRMSEPAFTKLMYARGEYGETAAAKVSKPGPQPTMPESGIPTPWSGTMPPAAPGQYPNVPF